MDTEEGAADQFLQLLSNQRRVTRLLLRIDGPGHVEYQEFRKTVGGTYVKLANNFQSLLDKGAVSDVEIVGSTKTNVWRMNLQGGTLNYSSSLLETEKSPPQNEYNLFTLNTQRFLNLGVNDLKANVLEKNGPGTLKGETIGGRSILVTPSAKNGRLQSATIRYTGKDKSVLTRADYQFDAVTKTLTNVQVRIGTNLTARCDVEFTVLKSSSEEMSHSATDVEAFLNPAIYEVRIWSGTNYTSAHYDHLWDGKVQIGDAWYAKKLFTVAFYCLAFLLACGVAIIVHSKCEQKK